MTETSTARVQERASCSHHSMDIFWHLLMPGPLRDTPGRAQNWHSSCPAELTGGGNGGLVTGPVGQWQGDSLIRRKVLAEEMSALKRGSREKRGENRMGWKHSRQWSSEAKT